MKQLFILTSLTMLGFISHCQTLRETELWIADKIETHDYVNKLNDLGHTITYKYSLAFLEDFLLLQEFQLMEFGTSYSNATYLYWIPIKALFKIEIENQDDHILMMITTLGYSKDSTNLITKSIKEEKDYKLIDSVGGFGIRLDKSFLDDDLPNRFKKAVSHLVELHGGEMEIVKEVF